MQRRRFGLTLLLSISIIISLIPVAFVFADGDETGSSLENAKLVASPAELTSALSTDGVNYIKTSSAIFVSSLTIPAGKTLIVEPIIYAKFSLVFDDLTIENGATLINNSYIGSHAKSSDPTMTGNGVMSIQGTLVNNNALTFSAYIVETGGILNNAAGAVIDESASVIVYGGTLNNEGQISGSIYLDSSELTSAVNGYNGALAISQPTPFSSLSFTPITPGDIITANIGSSGATATPIVDPNNDFVFARGYAVDLLEGESFCVVADVDFLPRFYFWKESGGSTPPTLLDSESACINYTVPAGEGGTYRFIVTGATLIDHGHATLYTYTPTDSVSHDFLPSITVSQDGNGWSWNQDERVLTLNNYAGATSGTQPVFHLPSNATIVLAEGTKNFISSQGNSIISNQLTITGSGELYLASNTSPIAAYDSLTLQHTGSISLFTGSFSIMNGINQLVIDSVSNLNLIAPGSPTIHETVAFSNIMDISIIDSKISSMTTYTFFNASSSGTLAIHNSDITIKTSPLSYYPHAFRYGGILDFLDTIILTPEDSELFLDSTSGTRYITSWTAFSGSSLGTQYNADQYVRLFPAYDVSYSLNAPSLTATPPATHIDVLKGQSITLSSTNAEHEGFAFVGWNTAIDGSGDDYAASAIFTPTASTELFAQWVPVYTVTFEDWDGTELDAQSVIQGQAATAPTDPVREGYTFYGWDVSFSDIQSEITVTALYQLLPTPTSTPTPTPISTPTPTPTPSTSPTPSVTDAPPVTSGPGATETSPPITDPSIADSGIVSTPTPATAVAGAVVRSGESTPDGFSILIITLLSVAILSFATYMYVSIKHRR